MVIVRRVLLLFLIPACVLLAVGCKSRAQVEKERRERSEAIMELKVDQKMAEEKFAAMKEDKRVLAPSWYLERCQKAEWLTWEPQEDSSTVFIKQRVYWFYYSPLLWVVLGIGVVLYPSMLVVLRLQTDDDFSINNLGDEDTFWQFVGIVLGTYGVLFLASLVVSGLAYLIISMVMPVGTYVPRDFVLFCLHLLLMLLMFALIVAIAAQGIRSPLRAPTFSMGVLLTVAMKSLAVATLSGIASLAGGWLAGMIVFAITSGVMAMVGGGSAPDPDN